VPRAHLSVHAQSHYICPVSLIHGFSNTHTHAHLQEYLGSYVSDASGRLTFCEGALVTAVRKGHWVVLDELNLAPSEVLEALNR
jgi:midasin (ATPase involved in ribosome maturation)